MAKKQQESPVALDATHNVARRDELEALLLKRYRGADFNAIGKVLCPVPVPLNSLDKSVTRLPGCSHSSARFTVRLDGDWSELMQPGRTGKFVSADYVLGDGVWREIAKGRILAVDHSAGLAQGEIYVGGGGKGLLNAALAQLSDKDYLEIDQYGASAKVLSALVEHSLAKHAVSEGFIVRRMPEDVARHIGSYYFYDFEFERKGIVKRIEVKSLWGTDTRYARLIHSLGKGYETSSCRFEAQDIFAVSLFLKTGDIRDFAFARSVPIDVRPYGLPRASKGDGHVNQNPLCEIDNGSWFATINEVWDLE